MKKILLPFIFLSTISLTVNASTWLRGAYIVAVQSNCDNMQKVRVFYSYIPNQQYSWYSAACTKDNLDSSLTKSFLTLSMGAMSLGQKVDLEISDHGYLNDIIVRAD
ncbi:hypothetical protein [Aeromonas salmonicida]|uniref:hypothetical protein n=1 Tax=Aeromonas salmonicida TaxID=645 RepID=UPI0010419B19|nr:hypothetical protein [Aeromonas salmonicida]